MATVLLFVGLFYATSGPNLAERDLVALLGLEPRNRAPEARVLPIRLQGNISFKGLMCR